MYGVAGLFYWQLAGEANERCQLAGRTAGVADNIGSKQWQGSPLDQVVIAGL